MHLYLYTNNYYNNIYIASLSFSVALFFLMTYLGGMKYYVSVNILCTLDFQLTEFVYIRLYNNNYTLHNLN